MPATDMTINTPLTRLLGITTPVVAAPMAGASGGVLAAQVSAAGAFGFLAAGYLDAEALRTEIALARDILHAPPSSTLPIGVGYLAWRLEKASDSEASAVLDAALDAHVHAIWLAFGAHLEKWIRHVRAGDAARRRSTPTLLFVQVSSIEEARMAVQDWQVDVLVAQGNEAGGHGPSAAPPLLTLIPSILSALPPDAPPVLAAGGLTSGRHVAALLTLGAAGAVLGTRFLATPESLYSPAQKRALVAAPCAPASTTVRTMAFDRVRGTVEWPAGVDGRALHNSTVSDMDAGVSVDVVRERFARGVREGDPDRMLVWAGTGVGLISEVKDAKDVVLELHGDIIESLTAVSSLYASLWR